jgi:hypothetical protein
MRRPRTQRRSPSRKHSLGHTSAAASPPSHDRRPTGQLDERFTAGAIQVLSARQASSCQGAGPRPANLYTVPAMQSRGPEMNLIALPARGLYAPHFLPASSPTRRPLPSGPSKATDDSGVRSRPRTPSGSLAVHCSSPQAAHSATRSMRTSACPPRLRCPEVCRRPDC